MIRRVPLAIPCTATGVGSLPFVDAAEAVSFVAKHAPFVPFCPELPRRCAEESLLGAAIAGWRRFFAPRSALGSYRISKRRESELAAALGAERHDRLVPVPAALPSLVQAIERDAFPAARALKLQCIGPYSLAASIHTSAGTWLESARGRELAWRLVARLAETRLKYVEGLNLPVVLVFDEPLYAVAETDEHRAHGVELWRQLMPTLRTDRVHIGLHICAAVDPGIAEAAELDVLSCTGFVGGTSAQGAVRSFQRRGGITICGAVPTWPVPEPADLPALGTLRGSWPAEMSGSTWISATCGLALLDSVSASANFEHAADLAAHWSELAVRSDGAATSPEFRPPPHPRILPAAAWVEVALSLWNVAATPELAAAAYFGGPDSDRAQTADHRWRVHSDPHDKASFETEVLRLGLWSGRLAPALDWIRAWRVRRHRQRFRGALEEFQASTLETPTFPRSPLPGSSRTVDPNR